MDILQLLRQGWAPEDVCEEFDEALKLALIQLEKERKEEAAAAQKRKNEARACLGAALLEYAIASGKIECACPADYTNINNNLDLFTELLLFGEPPVPTFATIVPRDVESI